ncbi:MAG: cytochrome c3 family protein, partial [Nitrosomonadales bacterium]|nr:cytochrome c3 family protein [Nitrosomonadales bacterium]
CHSTGTPGSSVPTAASFDVFLIGTDLRNDHPVGIRYPTPGPGVDFNPTNGGLNNIAYFDGNNNRSLDSSDIRLYNTGQGFEVECASCHDPHGVPSNGPGTVNNKSFMRMSNTGSALCLTCHVM